MKVMFSCFECNLSECLFLFTGCEKRFQWNATFNSRVAGTVQKGGAVCVWTCVHIQPSGMSSRCADIPQGSPQSTTCAYGVYIYRQYFIGFCGKPLLHKFVFQKLNRKQLSLISESKWVQPWYPTGRHCSFVFILHTHISFSTNLHILLFASQRWIYVQMNCCAPHCTASDTVYLREIIQASKINQWNIF